MWKPIKDLVKEDKPYLLLIPISEIDNIVLLAIYNDSIDAWIDMSGRYSYSNHVTHYMEYEPPTT